MGLQGKTGRIALHFEDPMSQLARLKFDNLNTNHISRGAADRSISPR